MISSISSGNAFEEDYHFFNTLRIISVQEAYFFGMNTAFEVFQRTLQHGMSNCEEQYSISDDIIVHGHTQEEHDGNLERVPQRLDERNVTLKKEKCISF